MEIVDYEKKRVIKWEADDCTDRLDGALGLEFGNGLYDG